MSSWALQWLTVYAGGLPVARLLPDGSVESLNVYGALAHVPDVILKAGRTYRIIHDHLGSPRLVVDADTGATAQRLDYDVHGRVLVDTAPDFQPFGFAGGLHDLDTGLVRFGARDYDPDLARWTAKDPSGFAGNDTNLYAYAYGDPVNFVDPDGELAFLIPLAIVALKGALVGAATDAGMELASQLIENGGNIDCLDWGNVMSSGVNGGISGGLTGPLGKALTGVKGLRRAAGGGDKAGSVPNPRQDRAAFRSGREIQNALGRQANERPSARRRVESARALRERPAVANTANSRRRIIPKRAVGPRAPPTARRQRAHPAASPRVSNTQRNTQGVPSKRLRVRWRTRAHRNLVSRADTTHWLRVAGSWFGIDRSSSKPPTFVQSRDRSRSCPKKDR
jgi:RHS repeat-associated protein